MDAIHGREALCEEMFFNWVSEKGMGGVFDTLGELLGWLDGIASCRWGCTGGDHQIEQLIGRFSATASASLLLLRRGYFDQALGLFRELEETVQLLELFTHSSNDCQTWLRLGDEDRKNRYSVNNVRDKLVKLGGVVVMDKPAYHLYSRYGVHPGSSVEPRSHDSVENPTVGMPFRPAKHLFMGTAVGHAVVRTALFGMDLVTASDVKQGIFDAVNVANGELSRIDVATLAQDIDLAIFYKEQKK